MEFGDFGAGLAGGEDEGVVERLEVLDGGAGGVPVVGVVVEEGAVKVGEENKHVRPVDSVAWWEGEKGSGLSAN